MDHFSYRKRRLCDAPSAGSGYGRSASLWCAVRDQRQYRSCGSSNHGGVPRVRVCSFEIGGSCREADRRRRDSDRKNKSGSVRNWSGGDALSLRRLLQRRRRTVHLRRIEFRLGGGRCRPSGFICARNGYGGLGQDSRRLQRHRRIEANPGSDQHQRSGPRRAGRSIACRSSAIPARMQNSFWIVPAVLIPAICIPGEPDSARHGRRGHSVSVCPRRNCSNSLATIRPPRCSRAPQRRWNESAERGFDSISGFFAMLLNCSTEGPGWRSGWQRYAISRQHTRTRCIPSQRRLF